MKRCGVLEQLNQKHNGRKVDFFVEESNLFPEEEKNSSTQKL